MVQASLQCAREGLLYQKLKSTKRVLLRNPLNRKPSEFNGSHAVSDDHLRIIYPHVKVIQGVYNLCGSPVWVTCLVLLVEVKCGSFSCGVPDRGEVWAPRVSVPSLEWSVGSETIQR